MPTIYDVAKRAGVSIATVSAVINKTSYVSPELTKRVKGAVEELDYRINHLAHSLQTRTTRTIGMLIPDVANPDPFYSQVVRGAEDVLRKKGYLLILGHTYNRVEEQSRYLSEFRARLVDGVLLFQAPGEDEELQRFIKDDRPVVYVGRLPAESADVVATDIFAGTKEGIDYLIEKGHRRIALVTVEKSMSVSVERIDAWRKTLAKRRVPIDEQLLIKTELSSDAGFAAAQKLLALDPRPTAMFLDNLVITTGVLRALMQHGLNCPDDVELISSDDAEWLDVFRPPISTVVQPSYEVGAKAAELLLKRIRHPGRKQESILLEPELRIRT